MIEQITYEKWLEVTKFMTSYVGFIYWSAPSVQVEYSHHVENSRKKGLTHSRV